jgi:mRNA interferase MazF
MLIAKFLKLAIINEMIRGEIYQANLNPTVDSEQSGNRPVLIVSRDGLNLSSPVIVIVPITKYKQGKKIYPSQYLIKVTESNGLRVDSIIKCEQIRAISKSRLSEKRGVLTRTDMAKIDEALKIVLSLEVR